MSAFVLAMTVLALQRKNLPPLFTLPGAPCYVATSGARVFWVFLGWGRVSEVSTLFRKEHISFMLIPWLSVPEEYIADMPDISNSASQAGILVDRSQYRRARMVGEQTFKSSARAFRLAAFQANPKVVFPGPPDGDLRSLFRRNKQLLGQIVLLAERSRGLEVVEGSRGIHDISEGGERQHKNIERIRLLLAKAGVTKSLSRLGASGWELCVWGFGSAVSDQYSEGFAYLKSSPHSVKTIDNFRPDIRKKSEVFSHLEGHWYLYSDLPQTDAAQT